MTSVSEKYRIFLDEERAVGFKRYVENGYVAIQSSNIQTDGTIKPPNTDDPKVGATLNATEITQIDS